MQPPQSHPTPEWAVDNLGALDKLVKTVVESKVVNSLLEALNEATSKDTLALHPPPPWAESVGIPPCRRETVSRYLARSSSHPPLPSLSSTPAQSCVDLVSMLSSASLPFPWMSYFLTYCSPPPSAGLPWSRTHSRRHYTWISLRSIGLCACKRCSRI